MSKFLNLNLDDFTRGLLVAIVVAVLTVIYEAINKAGLVGIDWSLVLQTAITSCIGYLLKNLSTNSNGKILKGE